MYSWLMFVPSHQQDAKAVKVPDDDDGEDSDEIPELMDVSDDEADSDDHASDDENLDLAAVQNGD